MRDFIGKRLKDVNREEAKGFLNRRFMQMSLFLSIFFFSCISFHTKKYDIKETDIPKGDIKPIEIKTKYNGILDKKYFQKSEESEYFLSLTANEKSTYFPTTYLTMFTLCLLPCFETVETSLIGNLFHHKTAKKDEVKLEISSKEFAWLPVMIYKYLIEIIISGSPGIFRLKDDPAYSHLLGDALPIVYNKFKQMENEIQKQRQDILDNFRKTVLGNLKTENVLVLNDLEDKFNLAHFNKKDFPYIFNSVQFESDEFQYQKEKPILNKIRNQKYLLIHLNAQ